MNNTIKNYLLLGCFSILSIGVKAQTQAERQKIISTYDLKASRALSERLSAEYTENREKAESMAVQQGWPLKLDKDGVIVRLEGVTDDGYPLYYTTYNEGSVLTSRANHLQPGGSLGLNLTGSGMTVGMWDGEYPLFNHVDLVGRNVSNDGVGTTETHPTHVLGTMIGGGVNNISARGVAYEAQGSTYSFGNDIPEMAAAAAEGLLLSNHSYGFRASSIPDYFFGGYTSKSRDVDAITFQNRNYQPVIAAGNDGNGDYDLLSGLGTAKNTIVVANILGVTNFRDPSDVVLAGSSSWGPTDDNRIKPDISSKGTSVLSAISNSPISYGFLSGTSMAAPGVTGVLLLLQQYYGQQNGGRYMWSSTVRALTAHTANEAGAFDGPDSKFGWGVINGRGGAETIQKNGSESVIEERVLLSSETYTKQVLALGTQPLIATLAWTDPPGTLNTGTVDDPTPVLVNDLDIRITKDETTFFPWKLSNTLTDAAVKGDNTVDNIEKIEIDQPVGLYTVTVSHKSRGLTNPKVGAEDTQEYSLIITGIDADTTLDSDNFDKSLFSIWPNPANSILNISIPNIEPNTVVNIFDIQGRQIIVNKPISETATTISLDGFSKGVYLVRVSNENATVTKKLIVN